MIAPLVKLCSLRKSFGPMQVLRGVDLEVMPGEVRGIWGGPGSGKSTLANILAGAEKADSGDVFVADRVSAVLERSGVFESLSVTDNIFAGTDTESILDRIAPDISPKARVGGLSLAQKRMVELARVAAGNSRVIIFDEPTAHLDSAESARLFDLIRELRSRRAAVVYCSRRIDEILELSDQVIYLQAREEPGGTAHREPGAMLLEVSGLCDDFLKDISIYAREREVIGVTGLIGAGAEELGMALYGARKHLRGEVLMAGKSLRFRSPRDAIESGLGYFSEESLFLTLGARANVDLQQRGNFSNDSSALREFGIPERRETLWARIRSSNPRVLIVTETGPDLRQPLRDFAGNGNAVLLISADFRELLEVCERLYVMRGGRIAGELGRAEACEESILRLATGGPK